PSRPVLAALGALLAALGAPAGAQEAPAQPQRRAALMEGTHVFRRILFDFPFKPLESFDELRDRPGETILIILGRTDRLREVPGGLASFVRRGGAVLLATDRALPRSVADEVKATAGVSVSAETVVCLLPDACYQRLSYCPLVVGIPGAEPALLPKTE